MSLRFAVSTEKISDLKGDVLVVLSEKKLGFVSSVPKETIKAWRKRAKQAGFSGAWGTAKVLVSPEQEVEMPLIGLVGVGSREQATEKRLEGVRRAIGKVVTEARAHGARQVVVDMREAAAASFEAGALAGALVDGAGLAAYRFQARSESSRQAAGQDLQKVTLVVSAEDRRSVQQVVKERQAVVKGVGLARDLVNQPAADVTPRVLVDEARAVADADDRVSLKVLNRAQSEREGLTAFLAVARGSEEEPYFMHLTSMPKERTAETKQVWVVGKGITFDSGGLSLKPAAFMEDMKVDMAGAAAVLGLFAVLPQLDIDVEVHGVIAACENMPSGTAYRPGDVVTARNGKTIEVLNTDAEGRVTLADALSYAVDHEPDAIIDLATLTGACVVALGDTVAGLWSTDRALQQGLVQAARRSGEGLETMPLPEEYRSLLNSPVADLRNIGVARSGDAIVAALFLREFVQDVPWAHLDIAGPAHTKAVQLPYHEKGATGYGIRTLIEFLKKLN